MNRFPPSSRCTSPSPLHRSLPTPTTAKLHLATLGLAIIASLGCNPPSPVTNNTPKNKPSFEVEKGSTTSTPNNDPQATDNPSPDRTQPNNNSEKLEVAVPPPLPTPVNDNRPFMTLKPTESEDIPTLMKYLAESDEAYRQLVMAFQAQQVTDSIVAERGSRLVKMKLDAAEKILAKTEKSEERDAAICAKLESLSQLAGFKDVEAARQLEEFAAQAAKINNPKAAHQAKLVMFGFRLSEYDAGASGGTARLLEEMDILLAEKGELSLPDLRMMGQTLMALQRQGDVEGLTAAKPKIVAAFKDHPDFRIMMECWQLAVMGSEPSANLEAALTPLLTGSSDGNVTGVEEATKKMVETFPWMATLVVIARNAINVEYAGFPETAKVMMDQVAAKIDVATRPEIRQDLDRTLADFAARYALLNQPFPLEGLQKLDGSPVEPASLLGKATLINFWDSRSQPSISLIGDLKKIYEKYHSAGFEIVGINLEEDPQNSASIRELGSLPWHLVYSADPSARGYNTPLAKKAGVSAVPFLMLLDASGNVVALHVRDAKLTEWIQRLLPKP